MRIYEGIEAFQKPSKAVVTMGTFDGVHWGHQQLLQQLLTNAQERGGEVVMVTFWPHPRLVLAPTHPAPIQLLTTLEEKTALLAQQGVAHLLKIPFTKAFAQLSAQDFVKQVLIAQVGMTQLVVGHDHRFGKDRAGDVALLQEAGRQHGFTVTEVPPVMVDNRIVSSTKIRKLLLAGDVAKAQAYLGRPYAMDCAVLPSNAAHEGSLQLTTPSPPKLIPADGGYTVQVMHPKAVYEGLLRIACMHASPTMELAIPDFPSAALHGQSLHIQFKKRQRPSYPELVMAR